MHTHCTRSEHISSWSEMKWRMISQVFTIVCTEEAPSAFRSQICGSSVLQCPFPASSSASFPSLWIPYIPDMILVLAFLFESYCFYQEFPSPLPGRKCSPLDLNLVPALSVRAQASLSPDLETAGLDPKGNETWEWEGEERAHGHLRTDLAISLGGTPSLLMSPEYQPNLYSSRKDSTGKDCWNLSQHMPFATPSASPPFLLWVNKQRHLPFGLKHQWGGAGRGGFSVIAHCHLLFIDKLGWQGSLNRAFSMPLAAVNWHKVDWENRCVSLGLGNKGGASQAPGWSQGPVKIVQSFLLWSQTSEALFVICWLFPRSSLRKRKSWKW